MKLQTGDKVTWADPPPDEPAWKEALRQKWEAEFGPPPYIVKHTTPFRQGEDLVYTKELYELLPSSFDKSGFLRSPRGLIQGWFKLFKKQEP